MPSLEALQKRFGPKDLTILALSVDDSWESIDTFMKQNQFNIPVYSDFDKKISVLTDRELKLNNTEIEFEKSVELQNIDLFKREQSIVVKHEKEQAIIGQLNNTIDILNNKVEILDRLFSDASDRLRNLELEINSVSLS